eukprot:4780168-Amphidinium_carterae.1
MVSALDHSNLRIHRHLIGHHDILSCRGYYTSKHPDSRVEYCKNSSDRCYFPLASITSCGKLLGKHNLHNSPTLPHIILKYQCSLNHPPNASERLSLQNNFKYHIC